MANRMIDQPAVSEQPVPPAPTSDGASVATDGLKPKNARRGGSVTAVGGRSRKSVRSVARNGAVKSSAKNGSLNGRTKLQPAALKPAISKLSRTVVKPVGAVAPAVAAAPRSLKQHIVPASLVGAAIAWYLLRTQVARNAEAKVLESTKTAANALGGALSSVGESAGEAYTSAAETTRGAVSSAAESVGHATGTAVDAIRDGVVALAGYTKTGVVKSGEAIRTGAGVVGETTVAGYRRSQRAVSESWDQHPLAVGATLLAAGVTAGMFLPAPRQSGALITRASADLSRKVTSKATELLEKGRAVVGLGSAAPAMPAEPPAREGRPRSRSKAV